METKNEDMPYTYVFVRTDMSLAQQIVQASHASLEAGFKYQKPDQTSSLILFAVDDEAELFRVSEYIGAREVEHVLFFEPDIDSYTALATKPLFGSERNVLSKYELYCPETKIMLDSESFEDTLEEMVN